MITSTFPTIVHKIMKMQKTAPSNRKTSSPLELALRLGMASSGESVACGIGLMKGDEAKSPNEVAGGSIAGAASSKSSSDDTLLAPSKSKSY